MKKLIVVINDLESSGKTVLARSLSHFFTEREIRHKLIATDEKDIDNNPDCFYWDLDDELDISTLIHDLDKHEIVILDVFSGAARNWAEFCEVEDLDTLLAEMDVEMTIVIPEHPAERCHEEIIDLIEVISDRADYVIAHCPLQPKGSAEEPWGKRNPAFKAATSLGAMEVTVPPISEDFQTALESAGLDLAAALIDPQDLPRFVEVPVSLWLEEMDSAFEAAQPYLLPDLGHIMVVA